MSGRDVRAQESGEARIDYTVVRHLLYSLSVGQFAQGGARLPPFQSCRLTRHRNTPVPGGGRILAPWIAPYDPRDTNARNRLQPPSVEHLLGTDTLGRDVLSRAVWGARVSVQVGILGAGLGLLLGAWVGIVAAYRGGWIEALLMRGVDVMMAFPLLLLAIIFIAFVGTGLVNIIIVVGLSRAPVYARITHSATLSLREREFVVASEAIGAPDMRVYLKHLLPNMAAPLIVAVATIILVESTLTFLGLGVPPPTPTWGGMINEGRQVLTRAPWIANTGGLAIVLSVVALNVMGDGLRDYLDPRLRHRG